MQNNDQDDRVSCAYFPFNAADREMPASARLNESAKDNNNQDGRVSCAILSVSKQNRNSMLQTEMQANSRLHEVMRYNDQDETG